MEPTTPERLPLRVVIPGFIISELAAYEMPILLEQLHASAIVPIQDVIFTHLDEETRWGKLWNFVLGGEAQIGFLSSGQNVPGTFHPASPERLLPEETAWFFPRN